MSQIPHPFTNLDSWIREKPRTAVSYRATDKDAKALVSAICRAAGGGCDGGPICHTDYTDPTRQLAGTFGGLLVYRGAQVSHFEVDD